MISREQFQASILPFTLRFEGGYANDKADNGGETYRGISRTFHPAWPGWAVIDSYKVKNSLKRGDIINDTALKTSVSDFYYEAFFKPSHLQSLDSVLVALVCFDFKVNGGFTSLLLQHVVNRKFKGALVEDGAWEANTAAAANSIPEKELSLAILEVRKQRFADIIKNNPSQAKFADGWNNRVDYLKKLVSTNAGKA
jgi:lysozyme family protein